MPRNPRRPPSGPPVHTRWKPGQSGNPSGRPKTAHVSRALRERLGEPFPDDPEGRTYGQVIADQLVNAAAGGDIAAAREVTDRTEGKAPATLDINAHLKPRFVVESPGEMTGAEWMAQHVKSSRALLEEQEGVAGESEDPSGDGHPS